jgi:phospholipid/cholesterol/gamma-HCH transport system substrate-binding protein
VRILTANLGERGRQMIAGAITIILLSSLTVGGVRIANGALRPRYQVVASFEAAGQGLLPLSDVKIRGVNIGAVKSIELRDGRAWVRMDIDDDERVPVAASATIRPKTLFGEKFVDIDPGPTEATGPFLGDEDEIVDATGGFELERVLSDAFPILDAVDPEELALVISELVAAGRDLGPTINRTIVNFGLVADQQAGRLAELEQFLDDLALLVEAFASSTPDLLATADHLNAALPPLSARGDELALALESGARLSADLADLLEANRPVIDKAITQGGKTLEVLFAERGQLPGLVKGLRYFFEVLGSVGRIPLGDGTNLAAVKGILGGGPACGRTVMGCPVYTGEPAGSPAPAPAPSPVPPLPADLTRGLPAPQSGAAGIISLVEGLIGQ